MKSFTELEWKLHSIEVVKSELIKEEIAKHEVRDVMMSSIRSSYKTSKNDDSSDEDY